MLVWPSKMFFGFEFRILILSCAFSIDNLRVRMDGLN